MAIVAAATDDDDEGDDEDAAATNSIDGDDEDEDATAAQMTMAFRIRCEADIILLVLPRRRSSWSSSWSRKVHVEGFGGRGSLESVCQSTVDPHEAYTWKLREETEGLSTRNYTWHIGVDIIWREGRCRFSVLSQSHSLSLQLQATPSIPDSNSMLSFKFNHSTMSADADADLRHLLPPSAMARFFLFPITHSKSISHL